MRERPFIASRAASTMVSLERRCWSGVTRSIRSAPGSVGSSPYGQLFLLGVETAGGVDDISRASSGTWV